MTIMHSKLQTAESTMQKSLGVRAAQNLTWHNPNDEKIYQLLKKSGPLTRADLVKRTDLARTTIYDTLTRLSIRGLVVRFSERRQSRGRRRVFYEVMPSESFLD